jgi:hypothetical protein
MRHLPRREDLPPGIDRPRPISVTFIPATVFDNPALLQINPEYYTWLLSLPTLERERLLCGNWKIRPTAGLYFKREWCAIVDEVPADLDVVRYWDLAATEKTQFNDPDWTVGIKLGRDRNGGYWLLDVVCARSNPGDVERLLRNTAEQDGKRARVGFGQDPGPGRQEPGPSSGARPRRLHCEPSFGERRQAHQVRAVQFAVPRRQCEDPARLVERGGVPRSRGLPRSRP